MIFENNNLSVEILSFSRLTQENVARSNRGRSFDSLSFRFNADTSLITEKGAKHVASNYVCFVPSNLSYDRIAKVDDLIAINCRVKGYTADDIETFLPANAHKIETLFKKAHECWCNKDVGYYHRCIAYFYQILAECSVQNAVAVTDESKIQASVDYINSSFANPELSIGEIAAKSFMSEVYFRKKFKEEYGTSPQKYVVKLRLQKATELIETGDYSLKEVALMCGYTDYKYFSSEFKRTYGVSPSEY